MNLIVPGVLVFAAVCGAAVAVSARAPDQEVARHSLDLLKTMAQRNPSSHNYVAACVTVIAAAKRREARKDVHQSSVRHTWAHAAGQCRGMASTVCEVWAQQAPRDACNRIRSFDPVS